MSVVTGVLLLIGAGDWEEQPIAEVRQWLESRNSCWVLRNVEDHGGGNKHPQFEAWCAGINHFLEEDEFAAFVMSRAWRDPENTVLILQPEDGPTRVFVPESSWGETPTLIRTKAESENSAPKSENYEGDRD